VGRRRWVISAVVAVVVAAAGAVAVADPLASPRSPGSNPYPIATATVTRQSLTSQTQVQATLGDAGAYSVVNQAQGTITELPAIGATVRQGHVLYQLSGGPVVLLYGPVPAYRALSDGMTGADVTELNADLVRLGYASSSQLDPRSDTFSLETAYALEKLQAIWRCRRPARWPWGRRRSRPARSRSPAWVRPSCWAARPSPARRS